jgi:hypothetical protein
MHLVDLLVAAAPPFFAMTAREPTFFFRDDLTNLLQYSAIGVFASMVCLQQSASPKSSPASCRPRMSGRWSRPPPPP